MTGMTGGRERLMEAALQLAVTTGGLASLGLREVARRAGLNPNTFYRHFKSFDDLGLALVERLGGSLREGLRTRRQHLAVSRALVTGSIQGIVSQSLALFFDFVLEHRETYTFAMRELHGGSPPMRARLRQLVGDIAEDLAADLRSQAAIAGLDESMVSATSLSIVRHMTFVGEDFLEAPEQRAALAADAERFVLALFRGTMTATPAAPTGAVRSKKARRRP